MPVGGPRNGPGAVRFEWSPDEYFEQEVLVKGVVEGISASLITGGK